jgi:hypothetical protein
LRGALSSDLLYVFPLGFLFGKGPKAQRDVKIEAARGNQTVRWKESR